MAEYIERDSVLTTLLAWYNRATHPLNAGKYNDGEISAYSTAMSVVELAPAEDVAPVRHGKWLDVWSSGFGSYSGTCSCCRNRNDIPPPRSARYCPNCGAKMDL